MVWGFKCTLYAMGGSYINANGQVIEELTEERELVCLNDGRGTRID